MRKEQVKKNPRDASITTKQDNNTPKSLELSEGQLEIRPIFEADDFGEAFTPELREQEERLRAQMASQAS